MSAHTPGPWFAVIKEDGYFQIEDSEAATSAVLCTRFPWAQRSDEMAANARLMATAPELLATLQEILRIADLLDAPGCTCKVLDDLERAFVAGAAAVNKATGAP